jgi:hypothetical protein
VTVCVLVAVIANTNVTEPAAKYCTACEIAIDCDLLRFRLQREFPRRDAVRMPQCEEEASRTVVALVLPVPI